MGTNSNVSSLCKRFGNFLTKFDQTTCTLIKYPIEEVLGSDHGRGGSSNEITNGCDRRFEKRVLGLYVTPIAEQNFKFLNKDVTEELKLLYSRVNEKLEELRCFEVVQICYPLKLVDSPTEELKLEYEKLITQVPWFAVPVDEIEKCVSKDFLSYSL